jgi:YjbE family integral membrane protein
MNLDLSRFAIPLLEIVWIDVVLSGDNAIVIALACARLPPRERTRGIVLGTLAAVGLRIVFTILFVELLTLPFLRLVGGLLLLWIGVKLARDERRKRPISPAASVLAAVWLIVVADAVMSLDNMIAVAAAAKGSVPLVVFGLALSIPLIVFGSSLLSGLFARFPVLVWAGAALLGFIGGELIGRGIAAAPLPSGAEIAAHQAYFTPLCGLCGAIFVAVAARLLPHATRSGGNGQI